MPSSVIASRFHIYNMSHDGGLKMISEFRGDAIKVV